MSSLELVVIVVLVVGPAHHQQQSAATSLRAVTGQSRTRCSRVRTWQSCTKPGSTRQFSRKQTILREFIYEFRLGKSFLVREAFQETTETQYQNTFPTRLQQQTSVQYPPLPVPP
ncbi:hypothetical protein I7I48_02380 [Histoplasma ohiense]|nr:hypothetical protein I7I48_02380 [Histoplasma ohiense (nom. inval.)]